MVPFAASHPPATSVEVQRWVLDSPAQLCTLRTSLQQALAGQLAPEHHAWDDMWEKMAIVVTELASNALRHALPPTVVRLCRADEHLILDVVDHAPATAPVVAVDRAPGAGGLGLRLAQQLAPDIGWYVADATKHVWAQFPAPGSDPPT